MATPEDFDSPPLSKYTVWSHLFQFRTALLPCGNRIQRIFPHKVTDALSAASLTFSPGQQRLRNVAREVLALMKEEIDYIPKEL